MSACRRKLQQIETSNRLVDAVPNLLHVPNGTRLLLLPLRQPLLLRLPLLLLLLLPLLQTIHLARARRVIGLVHVQWYVGPSPRIITWGARRPRALGPRRRLKRTVAVTTVSFAIRLKALNAAVHYADCRRRRRTLRLPKTPEGAAVMVNSTSRRRHVRGAPETAAEPARYHHGHCRSRIRAQ